MVKKQEVVQRADSKGEKHVKWLLTIKHKTQKKRNMHKLFKKEWLTLTGNRCYKQKVGDGFWKTVFQRDTKKGFKDMESWNSIFYYEHQVLGWCKSNWGLKG